MTALSVALSGLDPNALDLREGSLFGPVTTERFDLVVSNPPFVISPSHRFTYRDVGLPGDELSRLVVRGAAAHLAPGGIAAVLGNWLHVSGQDWAERVAEWVAGTGVNAWIVERDAQPVADYHLAARRRRGRRRGLRRRHGPVAGRVRRRVGRGGRVRLGDPPGSPGRHGPRADPWVLVEDLSRSERLPRGDEVLALLAGCGTLQALPAPVLLACPARLVEGATVSLTTHVTGPGPVQAPPRIGLAGAVGPGGGARR